jgi:glycosyltransferase 2 family protein
MTRRVLRWAQPLLLVAALISVFVIIASQWDILRSYPWQLNPSWMVVACLMLLVTWAVEIGIWLNLLRHLGGALAYGAAVRIWFLSAIVRYVPGNIWQPLSMAVYCQRLGIRPEITVTSILFYQVIILLAACPIAAVYFSASGNLGLLTGLFHGLTTAFAAALIVPLLVFFLRPELLTAFLNWLLVKLRRPALSARLSRPRLLLVLAAAFADWLLWGLTFAALVFAIGGFDPRTMLTLTPHLVASFPIAYAVGFLSLITPSGFGVREGAFVVLLAPLLNVAIVTVLALAMRFFTTLGELFMAGVSLIGARRALALDSAPPHPVLLDLPAESELGSKPT